MSRPIKLRGWDKPSDNFPKGCMTYFDVHQGIGDVDVVMQFTGLHDKNGVEIYEGDILKHEVWGKTEVRWDNLRAGYGAIKGNGEEFDCGLSEFQLKRTKVIGNIHTSPELLTK